MSAFAITGEFVLPGDVVLAPVADLPEPLREQLDADAEDFALSRPGTRSASRIVDAQSAELLERFRSPSTIVQAVIGYSEAHDAGPERTLEEAYPMLQRLIAAGVLVAAGSERAEELAPTLQQGERIAGYEVVAAIQQLEDTELHQVRAADGSVAALKLFKGGEGSGIGQFASREAAVLERIGGGIAPRLLAAGEEGDAGYLVLEWIRGVPAPAAAAELRSAPRRAEMLALCRSVVGAYVQLHARGVVHSDVHPSNILVTADGSVRLLDFGVARVPDGGEPLLATAPRAGVPFFFEPEYAVAMRERRRPPSATARGEQHAVAALLYLLVTGTHYLDFSLEQDEMLRQIADDDPLPFAGRGVDPWPALEALLARALSKRPEDRFRDLAALDHALGSLATDEQRVQARAPAVDMSRAVGLLDETVRRLGSEGPFFSDGLPTAPTCSVNYGAAGIAYGLYRLAGLRDDPGLLADADLWITKALAHRADADAWHSDDIDVTPERVGPVSSFHTVAGAHCVAALVSHARGDAAGRRAGVDGFIHASSVPCSGLDLTLGRASTVLACCTLLEAIGGDDADEAAALRALGDRVLGEVWDELDTFAAIRECEQLRYLGIAHGWAGILYVSLRWSELTGVSSPKQVERRLDELAACAEPAGRGLRWRVVTGPGGAGGQYMSGWCNGSSGYVHLWTLAQRVRGDEHFRALAEGAAWNAWESDGPVSTVCCGRAGRAYALLNLYRHTDDDTWLRRARVLANRAASESAPGESEGHDDSLYKGRLGPALLAADQAAPQQACLPFFEPEGWPR